MPKLKVGGHQLYYEWRDAFHPERETAVYLHDGLGATGSWKDFPDRIGAANGLNALVFDRYGYGRSQARRTFGANFMEAEVPVLLELLDKLGLARAHLIGQSDGASIALVFAALHPRRVITLVAEAAHTFVERETLGGIRALRKAAKAGKLPAWLTRLHGKRGAALLEAWSSHWLSPVHAEWSIEKYLGYIECPVLVVQGDRDEFGTEAQVTSIVNRVGGAETWIADGCGHTPHNEAQEAFLERVTRFLRQRAGGGG